MCCHPALVPGFEWTGASAKLKLLMESLEEALAEGHRALVFSQWTSFLDLIGAELSQRGQSHLRLDGSTRNRGELVERFQSRSGGENVMLISLKAGGVGLNLTSADHVYIMDPWWNPSVEDQAADRAYRIGQLNPVLVHKLICSGTLEEKILELQNHKRGLAKAVLDGSEVQSALTREDLMFLLS